MIKQLFRSLDNRLGIRPLLSAFRLTQAEGSISPWDAPPISPGRLAILLLILLALSGLALTLFYDPSAEKAATSLKFFHEQVPFGWLIHNTHRWSALLLVAIVILHALRIWLSRAFLYPRDLNWWIGIFLLVMVLFMGITGYLLRWDTKAFVLMDLVLSSLVDVPVVGRLITTIVLGGSQLDVVPLYRGYALHIWFLPFVMVVFVVLHLLIVWRQGLSEVPQSWRRFRKRLPLKRWPDLIPGLLLLLVVLALSVITPHAGLAGSIDRSPWPHPDWLLVFYFLPFWFFKGDARAVGVIIAPSLLLAVLVLAPRLRRLWSSRIFFAVMAIAGLAMTAWLLVQTAAVGSQVPLQGCSACHRPKIIGGAPTQLSEFEIQDPDWIIFHLTDPQGSLLVPFSDPLQNP